ncbi:MAG: enoyl-CoA hydratase/isomerase family protein [Chloroflexi bacterium]|nr:enoyl-CoA hydratase/isomerase family protein [Chloroflexota bacterium]
MGEALERAHQDSKVKVIIITGAGRGFCSGGDRKMAADRFGKNPELVRRPHSHRPFYKAQHLFSILDRPVIAAVNGPAIGGGMDIALWADIRIASERATFGEFYINRGLVPDLGGLYLLPRVVGYPKAAELLLTGDVIDAKTSLQIGLVNRNLPSTGVSAGTLLTCQRRSALH